MSNLYQLLKAQSVGTKTTTTPPLVVHARSTTDASPRRCCRRLGSEGPGADQLTNLDGGNNNHHHSSDFSVLTYTLDDSSNKDTSIPKEVVPVAEHYSSSMAADSSSSSSSSSSFLSDEHRDRSPPILKDDTNNETKGGCHDDEQNGSCSGMESQISFGKILLAGGRKALSQNKVVAMTMDKDNEQEQQANDDEEYTFNENNPCVAAGVKVAAAAAAAAATTVRIELWEDDVIMSPVSHQHSDDNDDDDDDDEKSVWDDYFMEVSVSGDDSTVSTLSNVSSCSQVVGPTAPPEWEIGMPLWEGWPTEPQRTMNLLKDETQKAKYEYYRDLQHVGCKLFGRTDGKLPRYAWNRWKKKIHPSCGLREPPPGQPAAVTPSNTSSDSSCLVEV